MNAEPAQLFRLSATDKLLLNDVNTLCRQGAEFYQQAAGSLNNSNLQRQFVQLATIHRSALRQLPTSSFAVPLPLLSNNTAKAIQRGYDKANTALETTNEGWLAAVPDLLQQELTLLKKVVRQLQPKPHAFALAHATAALQIAHDQLEPLLQQQ